MYEICKLLIIRYIFIKSDSSMRRNTKPSAIKQTIKYIRGKHPRLFAANMFFKPVGKLANPMPHFVWRFPK